MSDRLQTYRRDGADYEIEIHRDTEGYLASWRCLTCRSVGGKSAVYASREAAIEAARSLLRGHHQTKHAPQLSSGMFALVYTSQAVVTFDRLALNLLAARAAEKNECLSVTGYLSYDVTFETFFQFLEGRQHVVEDLMAEIERDDRHRVLNIVPITEAERRFAIASAGAGFGNGPGVVTNQSNPLAIDPDARMFPNWRMRFVSHADFVSLDLDKLLSEVLASMRKVDLGGNYVTGSVLDLSTQLRLRAASLAY